MPAAGPSRRLLSGAALGIRRQRCGPQSRPRDEVKCAGVIWGESWQGTLAGGGEVTKRSWAEEEDREHPWES